MSDEDAEVFLSNYSRTLGEMIERFPDNIWSGEKRWIINNALVQYLEKTNQYYSGYYPHYDENIFQLLRLISTKLKDSIERIGDKDKKLSDFLSEIHSRLEQVIKNLGSKYGNKYPEYSPEEKAYQNRYYQKYQKPSKKFQYGKTGLELDQSVLDQIMQICKDGESHKKQEYIDNIIPEEQMRHNLEQLAKIRDEFRKKNAELEANKKGQEENREVLSLSNETPLLEKIRKTGKIIEKVN